MKNKLSEMGMGAFRPETTPNARNMTPSAPIRMSPGTDADSYYSRRQQVLAQKDDDFDILESEEEEKESLNESVFEMIQRLIIDLMLTGFDITSLESMGMLLLPPRIATNVVQLYKSNKKAKKMLGQTYYNNAELKKLKKIRSDLGRDVTDMLTSLTSAMPIPYIDSAIEILGSQLSNPISGFVADKVINALENIENETIKKIITFGSLIFGGPIVYISLKNIQEIDNILHGLKSHAFHNKQVEKGGDYQGIPDDFNELDNEVMSLEDDDDFDDLDLDDVEVLDYSTFPDEEIELDDELEVTDKIVRPAMKNKGKVVWNKPLKENSITSCRVKKTKGYNLLETLEKVNEFANYAEKFKSKLEKINSASSERVDDIDLEEMSTTASLGGGPAVPLGYTAKGKPETKSQSKKRQKSYPYK